MIRLGEMFLDYSMLQRFPLPRFMCHQFEMLFARTAAEVNTDVMASTSPMSIGKSDGYTLFL